MKQTLLLAGACALAIPIARAQNFFVNNINTGTIQIFDAAGGSHGSFPSIIDLPNGLAFDSHGDLYVSGTYGGFGGTPGVQKLSSTGANLGVFANTGLLFPQQMIFDSGGNLYVGSAHAVRRFGPAGTDLGDFATIENATGLAFDSTGNLYVASVTGTAIEKFSPAGVDLGAFVNGGVLSGAAGLAFDPGGNLLVANSTADNVLKYDSTGVFVTSFASGGDRPYGLSFDTQGNLLVANFTDDKITVFNSSLSLINTITTGSDPSFIAVQVPEPEMLAEGVATGLMAFALARRRKR
ncbi:MAG TPA: NHL repeat-containing protein [Verrucomicrobiae bacterium]|nr:NHL repeat-containing protein [Verrucomicrobiae bacterium]